MNRYKKYLNRGDVFNRLTILGVDESSKEKIPSKWKYRCQCSCGAVVSVIKKDICNNHTQSCGCLQREQASKTNTKVNRIKTEGKLTKIFFYNSDNYTIIDTFDYELVKDLCWGESSDHYAKAYRKAPVSENIRLHRLLMSPDRQHEVDHKNNDRLDNRRSNLRICTRKDNSRNISLRSDNTSGNIGVSFIKCVNRYEANIMVNGKHIYIGRYKNIDDAVKARQDAEIKYFGEFAPCIHKEAV